MRLILKDIEIEKSLRNYNLWGMTNYFFTAHKAKISKNSFVGPLSEINRFNNFIISLSMNRIYFIPVDSRRMRILASNFIIINGNEVVSLKIKKEKFNSCYKVTMYTFEQKELFSFLVSKYSFESEKTKSNFISFISSFDYNTDILNSINKIKVYRENEGIVSLLDIISIVITIVACIALIIFGSKLIILKKLIQGAIFILIPMIIFIVNIKKLINKLKKPKFQL